MPQIDTTVSGRLVARLVPATPKTWRRWEDVADAFAGPSDYVDLQSFSVVSRHCPSTMPWRSATAHAHSARLYTRNAGDLVGIEHLVEIVPV